MSLTSWNAQAQRTHARAPHTNPAPGFHAGAFGAPAAGGGGGLFGSAPTASAAPFSFAPAAAGGQPGAGGFSLGGEQSGHVIIPAAATTGDGLLTAAVLLDVVARSGRTLGDLADAAMTAYPQVLLNVEVAGSPETRRDIAGLIATDLTAAEEHLAGRGRILVRPSGTEPLVRIMVEAESDDEARAIAETLAGAVRASTAGSAAAG